MAVLPEEMNQLDENDIKKSLSIMENYIRYMRERIEFSMSKMNTMQEAIAQLDMRLIALANLIEGGM